MKDELPLSEKQMESLQKGIEWMDVSKPSVKARTVAGETADAALPDGKALCPRARDMGEISPPDGVSEQDLRRWCGEHEL